MFRSLLLPVAATALGLLSLKGGVAAATAPAISWATTDGSTTVDNQVDSQGIALDDAGNVYTLGQADAGVTFGSLSCPDQSAEKGFQYVWLLKQDQTGAPLWLKCVTGESAANEGALAVNPSTQEVYFGGQMFESITIAGCTPLAWSSSGSDGFYAKLDASGDCVWAYAVPAGGSASVVNAATMLADGRVIFGGTLDGTTTTNGCTITHDGVNEGFLLVVTSTGSVSNCANVDIGGVLGLASDGTNIYAVDNLARVMKLTSALVETWFYDGSSNISAMAFTYGGGISTSATGEAFLGGFILSSPSIFAGGPVALSCSFTSSTYLPFILKFNVAGEPVAVACFDGPAGGSVSAMGNAFLGTAISSDGAFIIAIATAAKPLTIGSTTIDPGQGSLAVVGGFSTADLSPLWATSYGDASVTDTGAIGFAVAIRGNAVAYAGYYLKDLGQMCFSPPTPAVCVTETVGDTFMWNAFTPQGGGGGGGGGSGSILVRTRGTNENARGGSMKTLVFRLINTSKNTTSAPTTFAIAPIGGMPGDATVVGYRTRPRDKTLSKADLNQAVVLVSALKPKHWRTYVARVRTTRCPTNPTIAFQAYVGGAATGPVVQVTIKKPNTGC